MLRLRRHVRRQECGDVDCDPHRQDPRRARHRSGGLHRARQLVPAPHRGRAVAAAVRRPDGAPGGDPRNGGLVSSDFPSAARTALRDTQLRRNLAVATQTIRDRRARVVEERPDWQALRDAGEALKQRVLRHLDTYLVEFESAVLEAGGHVHWARDAAEAQALVTELVAATGEREAVDAESLAADRTELNEALAAAG